MINTIKFSGVGSLAKLVIFLRIYEFSKVEKITHENIAQTLDHKSLRPAKGHQLTDDFVARSTIDHHESEIK